MSDRSFSTKLFSEEPLEVGFGTARGDGQCDSVGRTPLQQPKCSKGAAGGGGEQA